MSNSVNKNNYEHFVPEAKPDEGFPSKYQFILLDTMEKLEDVFNEQFNYMSMDTETSSLDCTQGFLVGYSFCYDGVKSYYVPVKHFTGGLGKPALDLLYKRMCEMKQVFMYNARFDMRYMEYAGYDMSKVKYYDVQLAVVLADSNWKKSGLKWAESHFLGWKADSFEETLGDNANFYFVSPEEATFYAATDALGTFKLAQKTLIYYKEGGISAKIENSVLYPLMKMEDMSLRLDKKWLESCREEAQNTVLEIEKRIFETVGYTFELNSNKQKSEALLSLGITTGSTTKSGNMAVSSKAFDSVIERYKKAGENPPQIISDMQNYAKMFKLQGSYIDTIISAIDKSQDGRLRFSYKIGAVPTGRMACGKDGKNTYFAPINLQSIPKPHPKMWYYRKAVPESDPRYTILGWEFSLEPFGLGAEERWCEGKDPHLNIRNAFIPDDGQYWICLDFSAQELRIPANLTLDDGFVKAFTTPGGDPHMQTAIDMFGEENYNKEKRKIAKTFNFGLLYGMSTYSVAERYKIDLATAEKWVQLYEGAHKKVFLWMESLRKKAKKEGTVYNYFHRPRRVKYYLQSADPKMRAFGYRTVVNTSVQSVGADMTKLVLTRYWNNLYNNPKYFEYNEDGSFKRRKVSFTATIHDEVDSVADKDIALEAIKDMVKSQRLKIKGWPIAMDIGLEVGNRWGECFPFNVDQETGEVLGPDGELVNSQVEEKDEPEENEVEELEDFNFEFDL